MLRFLYLAATLAAIAVPAAAEVDVEAAQAAGMPKLIRGSGTAAPDVAFGDLEGGTHRLADWKGKALLVNFWATWCAPCRQEMPSLDALQAAAGGERFEVLTIAAGRNPPEAMRKFMAENGIRNLPMLTDPQMALARAFGVVGMPVSVLIDAEGNEVARLMGEADWNSDLARDVVSQLTAP